MSLRWTTTPPAGRGWFWFKATGDFHPMRSTRLQIPIIVIVGQDLRVRFFSGTFHVKKMRGLWAGPIEPPEDEERPTTAAEAQGDAADAAAMRTLVREQQERNESMGVIGK